MGQRKALAEIRAEDRGGLQHAGRFQAFDDHLQTQVVADPDQLAQRAQGAQRVEPDLADDGVVDLDAVERRLAQPRHQVAAERAVVARRVVLDRLQRLHAGFGQQRPAADAAGVLESLETQRVGRTAAGLQDGLDRARVAGIAQRRHRHVDRHAQRQPAACQRLLPRHRLDDAVAEQPHQPRRTQRRHETGRQLQATGGVAQPRQRLEAGDLVVGQAHHRLVVHAQRTAGQQAAPALAHEGRQQGCQLALRRHAQQRQFQYLLDLRDECALVLAAKAAGITAVQRQQRHRSARGQAQRHRDLRNDAVAFGGVAPQGHHRIAAVVRAAFDGTALPGAAQRFFRLCRGAIDLQRRRHAVVGDAQVFGRHRAGHQLADHVAGGIRATGGADDQFLVRRQHLHGVFEQVQAVVRRPRRGVDLRQRRVTPALQVAHAFQLPLLVHRQSLQHDRQRIALGARTASQGAGEDPAQLLDRLGQPRFFQPARGLADTGADRACALAGFFQLGITQGLQMARQAFLERLPRRRGKTRQQAGDAFMGAEGGMEALRHHRQLRLPDLGTRAQHRGRLRAMRLGDAGLIARRRNGGAFAARQRPPVGALLFVCLDLVHRLVGQPQQLLAAVLRVGRIQGHAQADGDVDVVLSAQRDRLLQRLPQPLQQHGQVVLAGEVLQHQHEFVTANARHRILRAQCVVQAMCHLDQHAVAGGVAVAVVDRLEVVQVEHAHRHQMVVPGRPRQRAFEVVIECAPVGQVGQCVVQRQVGLPLLFAEQGLALRVLAQRQADGVGNLVEQAPQVGIERVDLGRRQQQHGGGVVLDTAVAGQGLEDRPATDRRHLAQRLAVPHERHVGPRRRAQPHHRFTLHPRLGGYRHRRFVDLSRRFGQRRQPLDQRPGTHFPAQHLALGHINHHRTGRRVLDQCIGQRHVDRRRLGVRQQRALDRAMRIAEAAQSQVAFQLRLVVPEPGQLVG